MDINKQSGTVMSDDVQLGTLDVVVVFVESRLHIWNAERRFRFVSIGVEFDPGEIVENECGTVATEDRA